MNYNIEHHVSGRHLLADSCKGTKQNIMIDPGWDISLDSWSYRIDLGWGGATRHMIQ